jgi:5-methylcytosine-specific restriction enzyme A
MAPRNPPWQRDELILALDLYFKHSPSHISTSHPAVIELSHILNSLPIHREKPDGVPFRNPNGVYMKLCNFLRLDPSYKGKGLERGGKLEEEIWEEFANDKDLLKSVAQGIVQGIQTTPIEPLIEDEEDEFPEGRVLYRQHRVRERNRKLVAKTKEVALKKGKLSCGICGFDFYKTYGELGRGFIECHHTVPVSEYAKVKGTKLKDLALVCSNCHRMLHRRRPWLLVPELSELIRP